MTRFRNRRDAGRQLAEKIFRDHIGSEARGMLRPDAIVLAILDAQSKWASLVPPKAPNSKSDCTRKGETETAACPAF